MEDLSQLHQRCSSIFDLPHGGSISTRPMFVVNFDLPPEGSISIWPTMIVNFWPAAWRIKVNCANVSCEFWLAAHNYGRMAIRGSISTALALVVNFSPAAWRIYINFANVDREFLTFCPQALADNTKKMYICTANIGREISPCRIQHLYQLRQRWS